MEVGERLDVCPNCHNPVDRCTCACPSCGQVEGCDCAIGPNAATGG
ncbi:MAG TPA: hypothetical protein VJR06_02760 [Nitrososphaerales archaeon]|nr:hypothetical protein [Nitrososphaerales archaeon]